MKDTTQTLPSGSGATPGEILKAEREKQGLSIIDISSRLCLSAQFVEEIERDDYSHLAARVYARGHVKSYAHLLGIPEGKIISALDNVEMNFAPSKDTVAIDSEKSAPIYQAIESSQQHSSLILWGSILALVIIIGLVMIWWRGPITPPPKVPAPAGDNAPSQLQNPSGASPSSAPMNIPLSPQPQSQPQQPDPAAPSSSPSSPVSPSPANGGAPQKNTHDQSILQPGEFKNTDNPSSGNSSSSTTIKLPPPQASLKR